MGINVRYTRPKEKPQMNPIWRGVGCILAVVAPLVSFGLTILAIPPLLSTGLVPLELLNPIRFPDWVFNVPVLTDIAAFLGGINSLGLGIITFIVILILLTGIFSLIYVSIIQVIGPPRYSEIDAPPTRHKTKRYTR